jgi:hypothetical protein
MGMGSLMDKNKEAFIKRFRQDMLDFLTDNDGREFLRLYKEKDKLSKRGKKDFETMCKHPQLKRFLPH